MFNVHLNNTLVTHKIIKATINNNTSVKSTIITFFDYMISSFIIFFFLIIILISLSFQFASGAQSGRSGRKRSPG